MKKIIAANWKMNHLFEDVDNWLEVFLKECQKNKKNLENKEIVVCPPSFMIDYFDGQLMNDGFLELESLIDSGGRDFHDLNDEELNNIVLNARPLKLGGQDCHYEQKGAFTGDISAVMLKKIGCEYVIIGHSERRAHHFESDEIVNKKVEAAIAGKLNPIICVGESKEVRDQNNHLEFVKNQIEKSVPNKEYEKLIIAYEPIWSIGTGVVPTNEQIAQMAKMINDNFSKMAKEFYLLYGGSAKSSNAKEILGIDSIGGLLVGGASLDGAEFIKICLS